MDQEKKNAHFLIVDGNSIMNRAFYGMAGRGELTAPDGRPTAAVYAFFNILFSYQDQLSPEHILVCFDRSEPTFRHRLFEDYKAGRRAMPEDLALQMPIVKEGLRDMGYAVLEYPGYEADDLIASLCQYGEEKEKHVYVLSGDRDLWQLISEQVTVIFPYTKKSGSDREWMTPEAFRELYGFEPPQLLDLKALMGDSSDRIPGAPGIGEKTGKELIQTYGSLDGVYANLEEIKGAKKRRLEEGRESACLSYQLASLQKSWPFDESVEEKIHGLRKDDEALREFFDSLGMKKFNQRFGFSDDSSDQEKNNGQSKTFEDVSWEALRAEKHLALSLCQGDVLFMSEGGRYALVPAGEAEKRVLELRKNKSRLTVFDSKEVLKNIFTNLEEQPFFDCAIAAYLLNQHLSGSDSLQDFLRVAEANLGERQRFIADGKERSLHEAYSLLRIEARQRQLLKEYQMEELAYQLEFPLALVLARMENTGVRIDLDQLETLSADMKDRLDELEKEIFSLLGGEINLNSTRQLSEKLFIDLGLKGGRKLKDGSYSTAADELERLRDDHPVINLILEQRELSKLRSTFVEGLRKEIREDGKVHTTFKQTQTSTGRLSSAAPNLQNIPVRSDWATRIRALFIPDEGMCFVDADYSQIELRLLAVLSEDKALMEAFQMGKDVHRATASKLLGIPENEVDEKSRRAAKTVNFSIVYGVSDFGLARSLGISVPEARAYIAAYDAHHPRVRPWLREQVEFAKENGYVLTLLGRRRYIPELKSRVYQQRQFGERAAMNAPVQGTAADLIKLAMLRVDRAIREEKVNARLILQIHDELLIECQKSERMKVESLLKKAMEGAMDLNIPLTVEIGSGQNWAALDEAEGSGV